MTGPIDPLDQLVDSFRAEEAKLRRRTVWLSAVPVALGVLVVGSAAWRVSSSRQELVAILAEATQAKSDLEALRSEAAELRSEADRLRIQAEDLRAETGELMARREELIRVRSLPSAPVGVEVIGSIQTSLDASGARREVAAQSPLRSRQGIEVRVYSRDVDRDVVFESLSELGFKLGRRPPNELIPGAMPTNAVWFGARVGIEEVKLIALTLIRAGIELHIIEPFARPESKPEVVDVGSLWGGPRRRRPYTVQEILDATEFTSQPSR